MADVSKTLNPLCVIAGTRPLGLICDRICIALVPLRTRQTKHSENGDDGCGLNVIDAPPETMETCSVYRLYQCLLL